MNPDGLPDRADLERELRNLRRGGLPALQSLVPRGLRAVTLHAGYAEGEDDLADGAERLVRAAAERLGTDDLIGRAAQCTFGLLPGHRGDPAADRRRAAAQVYGVSDERYRHSQERRVVEQLAGAILAEAREPVVRAPRPAAPGPRPAARPDGARPAPVPYTGLPGRAGSRPVTVHVSPIELLRDIDVLVSSENIHLEMSKSFRPTVSGALRRAAVVGRSPEGPATDVLAEELAAWVRARPGVLPLRPGTVVPTGPGALAERGVRRVYHAALAIPDGLGYRVDPQDIATAVAACFARARQERAAGLRSICFPLLGAGRGGLDRRTSAEWLRWSIEDALTADPDWSVHIVTRYPETAGHFDAKVPRAPGA
ncbi:macro domain-containing protein [Streptomyces sp. NPDC057052]|uniref:macro domain-containing protein n=1 Tax=Streptomyces sp. NPDC057052 TaxID=3346010 RepID=UPI00362E4AF3